jgi:hypothetical protein
MSLIPFKFPLDSNPLDFWPIFHFVLFFLLFLFGFSFLFFSTCLIVFFSFGFFSWLGPPFDIYPIARKNGTHETDKFFFFACPQHTAHTNGRLVGPKEHFDFILFLKKNKVNANHCRRLSPASHLSGPDGRTAGAGVIEISTTAARAIYI